ncbi:MAG: hypothetical protein NTV15_05990, partial [Candidatus Bathyarchaeota archaeon]|nr:hypothetical protein [Candidatus Bathyarchaeota archaeon]
EFIKLLVGQLVMIALLAIFPDNRAPAGLATIFSEVLLLEVLSMIGYLIIDYIFDLSERAKKWDGVGILGYVKQVNEKD